MAEAWWRDYVDPAAEAPPVVSAAVVAPEPEPEPFLAPAPAKPRPVRDLALAFSVGPPQVETDFLDWRRLKPAWVVSGGLHAGLMIFVLITYWVGGGFGSDAGRVLIVEAQIDTRDDTPLLVNPDEGLDPSKQLLVEPSPVDTAPPSLAPPGDDLMVPIDRVRPADFAPPVPTGKGTPGARVTGGSNLTHRTDATARAKMLAANGGTTETEAAVGRGLLWLSRKQKSDGRWELDGTHRDDIAATSLALLAYLGAGQTHKSGPYARQVLSGLGFLKSKQRSTGDFQGAGTLYSHAIATTVFCEALAMTADPQLQKPAQGAANFIANAQHKAGGWRYEPGQAGDVSVTGWQYQALRSARAAGLSVPDATLTRAVAFLDSMSSDGGATYGYDSKPNPKDPPRNLVSMTAVGLLCRQYTGWGPQHRALRRGMDLILAHPPAARDWDVYYLYYATQVVHFVGGPEWLTVWNPKMRDVLLGKQHKVEDSPTYGSWPPDAGQTGGAGGRHATTCLCILTLEVYYRHLPLYRGGEALPGEAAPGE